jgi:hypothetical protein
MNELKQMIVQKKGVRIYSVDDYDNSMWPSLETITNKRCEDSTEPNSVEEHLPTTTDHPTPFDM